MNAQGVVLWLLSAVGFFFVWAMPLIALVTSWLWWHSKDKPQCYLALFGALLLVVGRVSHLVMPHVEWTFRSNVEYIPSGDTTFFEALAYLTFTNLGQGLFSIAVLLHFLHVRGHHA